jgi:SAM-dependent methyltransferase
MAQNVYDRPDFFAAYGRLDRSVRGLEGAAEWPALRAMLPPMAGFRVLDLGCGFGWFCRWARREGAAEVLGLDLSERMLARAVGLTADEHIRYERADLDTVELPAAAFDLVFSSLALHYVADFERLAGQVFASLREGGRFVFSTEHPIFSAPSSPAWTTDRDGRRVWPLDRYAVEGPRTTDWLAPGVVKHHRRIGTAVRSLLGAGFCLRDLVEWSPTEADLAAHPEWGEEVDRPMFLLLAVQRRGP